MSHQPPHEIKLEYMKVKLAHEVAMYRAVTSRRWVYLWAMVMLAGIISAAAFNWSGKEAVPVTTPASVSHGLVESCSPQTIPLAYPMAISRQNENAR